MKAGESKRRWQRGGYEIPHSNEYYGIPPSPTLGMYVAQSGLLTHQRAPLAVIIVVIIILQA
jgi:hypothetical protein